MEIKTKEGKINAARTFQALGKIGYSPESAILDIVDNSVAYGATRVSVEIVVKKIDVEGSKRQKTVIDKIIVKDNANGMDEDGLDNALSLGSDESNYEDGTLSKFGMGLKSASSSLGKKLSVVTTQDGSDYHFGQIDQDKLKDVFEYSYAQLSSGDAKSAELNQYLDSDTSGTVVTISI
jgi:hypothetical protein